MKILSLALLALLALNAVQSENENDLVDIKEFRILKTPHFDLYFSVAELEPKVRKSGEILESSRETFLEKFKFLRPEARISVFIHESWGSFHKSAIRATFGKISRLGFCEPLKNRIVVWLSPSERENFYQLRTNLAQLLIFQYLFQGQGPRLFLRYVYPEWLITGMALHLSGENDPFFRMALQDALLSGKLRPLNELKADAHLNPHETEESHRYMMEVLAYLEREYGKEKLAQVFKKFQGILPLYATDDTLKSVYWFDETQLNRLVSESLSKKWASDKEKKEGMAWESLTSYSRYYRHWDIGPSLTSDGKTMAFLSDRNDVFHLYCMDLSGRKIRKVIQWEHGWGIDDLQGLRTPPAYSPLGTHILVKARNGYRNCLFLIGTAPFSRNRTLENLEFDDYAGASFSPDGKSIVFAGIKSGRCELYRYFLESERTEPLTRDGMAKFHPSFFRDGTKIVYSAEEDFQMDLFLLDLSTREKKHFKRPGSDEAYPRFDPEGRILFTSDEGNCIDLCRLDPKEMKWEKLTDLGQGAVLTPALSPDGEWVYFSYYHQTRLEIYRAKLSRLVPRPMPLVPCIPLFAIKSSGDSWPVTRYDTQVGSDFIFPFLAVNALRVSDMSGTHHVQSQFGLFSGFIFDASQSKSGGSQVDIPLGIGGQVAYTYANFFSATLFGSLDYVEIDEKGDEARSLDYKAGGKVDVHFSWNDRSTVSLGYTLNHRKEFVNHRESVSHHYWSGGFFLEMEIDQVNRRGLDPTGGYALEIGISFFDRALGSDFNYQVFELGMRYYWSFCEDHILMVRLKGSIGHDDVPFVYDLGDMNYVRGLSLDEREGTERWGATLEYRFPLYRDLNFEMLGLVKDVRGFIFFDVGACTTDVIGRFSDWNDVDVVYSIGVGIRLDYHFLQHFALPLILQIGKRLDEDASPIFYATVSRKF